MYFAPTNTKQVVVELFSSNNVPASFFLTTNEHQ